ncbi:probable cellulase precursor [Cephalotrichum gorgonifer]|uniref:cellulase n=1 Tax=Cephalotrichum gorgonifer TaxID=2041049 RepID=A0AAE8MZF8_9PEZI|nr:probable cellulase precursor [Cephalotrichum gorgonifer]
MKLTEVLATLVAVSVVRAAPAEDTHASKRQSGLRFKGVSVAGAEFGNTVFPGRLGTEYTWPNNAAITTLKGDGMNTFRVGIQMERIIPDKLTGAIDEAYFSGLEGAVNHITGLGAYAVINPHNYGRYYGNVITDTAAFGAFWKSIASRFKDNSLVIFDTNNEYHDMDNALMVALNQAAVNGIRAAGATSQYIWLEANGYSGAWTFVQNGSAEAMKGISDPSDPTGSKLVYELHQYLDSDGSGTHDQCVSTTIGSERLSAATAWFKANGKKAVLGEIAGASNPTCIAALKGALQHISDNSDVWSGYLLWAAGPWWGDYMFSMEPPSGAMYTGVFPSVKSFF